MERTFDFTEKLVKDPNAILDYRFAWLDSLPLPVGDTLTASVWSVDPPGELAVSASTFDDDSATVWLTGGVAGKTYRLTNHVTTFENRQDDRTVKVKVKER